MNQRPRHPAAVDYTSEDLRAWPPITHVTWQLDIGRQCLWEAQDTLKTALDREAQGNYLTRCLQFALEHTRTAACVLRDAYRHIPELGQPYEVIHHPEGVVFRMLQGTCEECGKPAISKRSNVCQDCLDEIQNDCLCRTDSAGCHLCNP